MLLELHPLVPPLWEVVEPCSTTAPCGRTKSEQQNYENVNYLLIVGQNELEK